MINKNLPPVEFNQESFAVTSPEVLEGSQYVIFKPSFSEGTLDGSAAEKHAYAILESMKKLSDDLVDAGEKPGISHGYEITSLAAAVNGEYLGEGEITVGGQFIEGEMVGGEKVKIPEEFGEMITEFAIIAAQSGFDLEKSTFRVGYGLVDPRRDANRILHSDGLGQKAPEGTENVTAKRLRFVYSPDSGSVIYPDPNNIISGGPMSVDALGDGNDARDIPKEVDEASLFIKAPQRLRGPNRVEITERQRLLVDAQHVMPGIALAFDPSRDFWHHSPDSDGTRMTVVVDVDYMEHDAPQKLEVAAA